MNRPKAVVGVAVDVSCLWWASSDIYRVSYLKAVGYISMSPCATGLTSQSSVGPRRLRMEKSKPVHLSITSDHCLVTQHPWVQSTQQQLQAEMTFNPGPGEGGNWYRVSVPLKLIQKTYVHVHIYLTCVCMYVCVHVCMYVYICVRIYIYI